MRDETNGLGLGAEEVEWKDLISCNIVDALLHS